MPGFWSRPLSNLGLIALLALVMWPIAGAVWALLGFGLLLLGYIFFNLRQLQELNRWLANPQLRTVPEGEGLWEETFVLLYQLARRQSASQHQLSKALERFQRAGEAMPDGVVMLDAGDQIEWFNPIAAQQFGLNLETDIGHPITYLLRQSQFNEYISAHNYSEPLIMKSTRNPEITLAVQLVPFGDDLKLLLARDITRFEQVETMRRDFIANVSHELRTPLTVIGGFLESLQDYTDLSEENRSHFFSLMRDQTLRMQRLVEDLLTLSRLESAANPLHEEKVDVPALLRQLHQDAQGLSHGRHPIRLELESSACLHGAESELRSALGNLISNAVRYTPQGGEIVVRWEERADEARFSVKDSGIGIEPQHIPRLTERFYRVDRSRSRETGGTGLGLSIVKHVLTRHQARLEIESIVGQGSTFSVIFPATRVLRAKVPAVA
ncbi:MAG: phosphate regulon sensor histidine kinase PhoR [Betaproteobacteria bacterium RBG_19FT_COMBO_58_11]|nr:MAG: phosphate regulon sensor histidine kinase PhoR [Betaproteobacteria bacterium RBG_19FT_COMBO_58_11]